MENSSRARLFNLLRITMVAFGLICALALCIGSAYIVLGCPFPITYEGIELYSSWMLAHGENIYNPDRLHSQPWIVNIYPPLMSVVGMLFAGSASQLLTALRGVSMVCFVVTAVSLYHLGRRLGSGRAGAVGAVVFFVTCVPVWYTGLIAKPDFLSMMFESLALLAFWVEFGGRNVKLDELLDESKAKAGWYLVPALCCFAAIIAKQQGVLAPVAILAFLLAQRQYVCAARFGLLVVGAVGASVALLQAVTGGYMQHLSFLRHVRWSAQNILANLTSLGYDAVKVLLVLGFATFCRADPTSKRSVQFAVILCLVCFAGLALILGVPGATSNHFISPLFALALVAALAATRYRMLAPLLSVVSVVLVIDLFEFVRSQAASVRGGAAMVIDKVPAGGTLLSEDPYWVLAKKASPVIVDCTTFVNVWKQDPQGQAQLVEAVSKKAYSAIMINVDDDKYGGGDVWTREIVAAIKANYKVAGQGTGNGRVQQIYLP